MMKPILDAHIHFDLYPSDERERMIASFADEGIQGVITVSNHLPSCKENLRLQQHAPSMIFPAYGYHPEQELPSPQDERELFQWIREHHTGMAAIGEVGLPYYMRKEHESEGRPFELQPYIDLLERFVSLAAELNKPIVLHAVYEDAETVCDLLEKHRIQKAHFHWFKGSSDTLKRLEANGFSISVTPEVVYRDKIREIVRQYPLELLMVETDGPWPFDGPYAGKRTYPCMIRDAISAIAAIQERSLEETTTILYDNTCKFYNLSF
ncbi:TatD family hydrolase [Paenibacillus turpanensis]|uniref:TatD family hydrolase n=1 Tax=Paenibacillus turpanensis TaxID=2689078 RepID=UPI0014077824|nr:TatD family hydrolase [Paenibacillus turpanensis]